MDHGGHQEDIRETPSKHAGSAMGGMSHDTPAAHDPHSGHDAHADHGAHSGHDQHAAHDRHAGHSVAMFRDKFWLSLLLTIPVVIWSADIQQWLGYSAPTFPGSQFIPAVFGIAVFAYG